jgi:hypothetical protein
MAAIIGKPITAISYQSNLLKQLWSRMQSMEGKVKNFNTYELSGITGVYNRFDVPAVLHVMQEGLSRVKIDVPIWTPPRGGELVRVVSHSVTASPVMGSGLSSVAYDGMRTPQMDVYRPI